MPDVNDSRLNNEGSITHIIKCWNVWRYIGLFIVVITLGLTKHALAQDSSTLNLLIVTGDKTESDYFKTYLTEVENGLKALDIHVITSQAGTIPISDFPATTHIAIELEEDRAFLGVFAPKAIAVSSLLVSLPYLSHFSPVLELAPNEGIDARKFNVSETIALSLYALNRCDLAIPYFETANSEVLTSPTIDQLDSAASDAYSYYASLLQGGHELYRALFWGICALKQEDFATAIQQFKIGLEAHQPEWIDPAYATNLSWTYLHIGDEKQAFAPETWTVLTNGDKYIKDDTKVIALRNRAQLYALAERYDDAINDLNAAIELTPENPELYILRGQMYLYLYQWDNVLADYNQALELDPTYADAYFLRGVLYYSILQTGAEHYPDALADFQRYLELAPNGDHAADAQKYADQIQTQQDALNS